MIPVGTPQIMNNLFISIRIVGSLIAVGGFVCLILAPLIGENVFDKLWVIEPLTYIGYALIVAGLGVAKIRRAHV